MTPRLFHYTCDHGAAGIARDGFLLPNRHPFIDERLVWATDLNTPFVEVLGLTSFSLSCDRTRHRFEVAEPAAFTPWTMWSRRLPTGVRAALETAPGTMPRHWWVATRPVLIVPEVTAR